MTRTSPASFSNGLRDGHARIARSELPALAEFDTIRGFSGLGALLLHRGIGHGLLREVLTYLVRLTEPVKHNGDVLSGWWSHLAPSGALGGVHTAAVNLQRP